MARTIRELQQNLAENSGIRDEVIWDLIPADQKQLLMEKIKQLIPDQKNGMKAINECRKKLYNQVWSQTKYTNGNSLSAVIYVMVTMEENLYLATCSTEFSMHPVFRTRKCINNDDSSECCMVFVDENARVYQNWESFVEDNELPEHTMVVPKNGVYSFDSQNRVELEIYQTPAAKPGKKLLRLADTTSAGSSLLAAAVPIAALCSIPVAAPIMAGAVGVGLVSAGYSLIRSGVNLFDRSKHEQSIGLEDLQARNSWLGVKFRDDEKITVFDVVQLSTSLFLFTHSVNNFRLASTLISESQNATFQRYREGLINRQRRMFDKISKETIRIKGPTQGKLDIIRAVNEIPSKQYLNDLYKINKDLNKQNVRPSFTGDGAGVSINNGVVVDTQTLRNSVQHKIGPDVLSNVKQPLPDTHPDAPRGQQMRMPVEIVFNAQINKAVDNGSYKSLSEGVRNIVDSVLRLGSGANINLGNLGMRFFEHIMNAGSFEDVLITMAELFCEEAFKFLMDLAKEFIERYVTEIESITKIFISTESVLYKLLTECMNTYTDHSVGFLRARSENLLQALRSYFISFATTDSYSRRIRCNKCKGYYRMTA